MKSVQVILRCSIQQTVAICSKQWSDVLQRMHVVCTRMWYVHTRTTLVMCWLNVRVESSVTLNNFTASANCTILSATLTPTGLLKLDSRWHVPKITTSVVSGFCSSVFCRNRDCTGSEHLTTYYRLSIALGTSDK